MSTIFTFKYDLIVDYLATQKPTSIIGHHTIRIASQKGLVIAAINSTKHIQFNEAIIQTKLSVISRTINKSGTTMSRHLNRTR